MSTDRSNRLFLVLLAASALGGLVFALLASDPWWRAAGALIVANCTLAWFLVWLED